MASLLSYQDILITAAGGTFTLPVANTTDIYRIYCTSAPTSTQLLADVNINTSGTPVEGTTFDFIVDGYIDNSLFNFYFEGNAIKLDGIQSRLLVKMYYNGTDWNIVVTNDGSGILQNLDGSLIKDIGFSGGLIDDNSIPLTRLTSYARGRMIKGDSSSWVAFDAKTATNIVCGDGTDVSSIALSGDATLNAGVITIANNAVTSGKINTGAVTLTKLDSTLIVENNIIPHSFEANEVGEIFIKMNYACSITDIYVTVSKVLAGTDVGTVTLKDGSGTNMTVTTPISIPASSIVGYSTSSAITANNSFTASQILKITTAKTTAGGRCIITLKTIRS